MFRKKTIPLLEVPVPGRICWSCRHVLFDTGEPGYSEYTPGSEMSLSCGRGYWEFHQYEDSLAVFREKLQSAERCADFTRHDEG